MDVKMKWNKKYSDRIQQQKAVQPNERLQQMSSYFLGGMALDLACGQGGNSLFLAQREYQVEALDISDIAIDYLKGKTEKNMLTIHPKVVDLADLSVLNYDNNSFDLIIITYFLDRSLFPFIKKIAKNQGYFFMETFFKTPIMQDRQIPEQFKLDSNELLHVFKEWEILFFEESEQEGRQTILCRKP